MIAALPDYLARKVTKMPLPANLDEAISRTLQAFGTCPLPMQAQPYVPTVNKPGPVAPSNQKMDLDALRALPSSSLAPATHFPPNSQFNVFSGKPMSQTFVLGRYTAHASHQVAHMNAVYGHKQWQPQKSPRSRPDCYPDVKRAGQDASAAT